MSLCKHPPTYRITDAPYIGVAPVCDGPVHHGNDWGTGLPKRGRILAGVVSYSQAHHDEAGVPHCLSHLSGAVFS